jgi:hypothetical protein
VWLAMNDQYAVRWANMLNYGEGSHTFVRITVVNLLEIFKLFYFLSSDSCVYLST